MGRAARWLKALFGIKKDNEQNHSSNSGHRNRRSLGSSARGETGLCQNPATIPPNITAAEAAWLKSFYNDSDNEQSKHAIAVAAATAAAVDAAVAASQAAVAVVRLTSQGRRNPFDGGREISSAVRIQSVFRGYLARKALKALKGLVKLQALVRGFMVRKQATATLHGMQALIKAQATVRALKRHGFSGNSEICHTHFPESLENFDDTRSECIATIHSRRLSSRFEPNRMVNDESPKTVEMDISRPKSRSRRRNSSVVSDSGEDPFGKTLSSPYLSSRVRDEGINGEEWKFSTTQSTPRFVNCNGPVTPSKSVRSAIDVGIFRQYMGFPNYMANTQSFSAKLRSQSAPKQRPESGLKKRLSLNEMESISSFSGVRMRRSCSQAQEGLSFKNVVMSKLDKCSQSSC